MDAALARWVDDQRALVRALGLSLEDWLAILEKASKRPTEIRATALAASIATGHGVSLAAEIDGDELVAAARRLLDPRPERVAHPVLREAVKRSEGLARGAGAIRLVGKRPTLRTEEMPAPVRGAERLGDSAPTATPDAPGGRGERE